MQYLSTFYVDTLVNGVIFIVTALTVQVKLIYKPASEELAAIRHATVVLQQNHAP